MSERTTQTALLLRLLREHGTVSAHDLVYRFGVTRVAARVFDLKAQGHEIETIRGHRLDDGTQQMASYRLVEQPVQMEWTR